MWTAEYARAMMLTALMGAIDAAATPGKILCYAGTQPTGGGAPAGDLQSTIELAQPCGVISGSVLTFTPLVEGIRVDNEAITWVRFVDGDDTPVMDMKAGQTGDPTPGIEFFITNVNGFVGGFVRVDSGSISLP